MAVSTRTVSPDQLWRAAESGDTQAVRAALDSQVDVNARDSEGNTALMIATRHGRTKAVLALLAHGADPNLPDTKGFTPLRIASSTGNSTIIGALQKAGGRFHN